MCGGCNALCYGKTKHYFKVRKCEHLGASALTEKRVKKDKSPAIKEHHIFWDSFIWFWQFFHISQQQQSL